MTKYKRLTKRDTLGNLWVKCPECKQYNECDSIFLTCDIVTNRLAELEDKIENGTLIYVPCKVGDTVYMP